MATTTRKTNLFDEYLNELHGRIDSVQAKIVSGELSDQDLEAAKKVLADLGKDLENRIEQLKKEKEECKPKKLFGFI